MLSLVFMMAATNLWAGPPFQTDDPDPIDYRHYEFYVLSGTAGSHIENDPYGPAFELNWGALPGLHLHIIVPFGAFLPTNELRYAPASIGVNAYGFNDIEMGAKYRVIKETKHRPEIGPYFMMELPAGNSAKGLGVGKVWWRLPIWAQKSWGPWTTYGGAGYEIVPQVGYKNNVFGGWEIQRDLTKKFTLGGEVYAHGAQGPASTVPNAATLIDLGFMYKLKGEAWQLLAAYGQSVHGEYETYAYMSLYHTWGAAPGHGLNGLMGKIFK
jgi:hypothetical protein